MDGKTRLLLNMLVKGIFGFALIGLPLFACAGTLDYVNAWMLIASLFVLIMTMGFVLLFKYPQTLEKRLKSRESERAQRSSIAVMGVLFLASFVLAGLDHRFGWTRISLTGSVIALIILFFGYGMFAAVILQNSYASRVVEIQENQVVISTGLYAAVRHPMYLACLLVFLPMPIILGSFIALIPMLVFPVALVRRIRNEESVLASGLPGYAEYMKKTKYRLIPYIW